MSDKVNTQDWAQCPKCGLKSMRSLAYCPKDKTPLNVGDLPLEEALLIPAGTIIDGRYEVLGLLGMGGMGGVYKVKHTVLGTVYAIKTLHPNRAEQDLLMRFECEAKTVSILQHPNIVRVHDYGITPQGTPYLVMEQLEGSLLSAVFKKTGALERERFYNTFDQVCVALSHAHSQGVVHRDMKPENIMLIADDSNQDKVKILDFGTAKLLPQSTIKALVLTQTGEVFGSPLYMSPEQCQGNEVDHRCDIYSLGCIMFKALTGQNVFQGQTPLHLMKQQLHERPVFDAKTTVDLELQAIVLKCLQKDPAQRFQSMDELRQTLQQCKLIRKDNVASSTPKKNLQLVGTIVIGIVVLAGFVLLVKPGFQKNSMPAQPAVQEPVEEKFSAESTQQPLLETITPPAPLESAPSLGEKGKELLAQGQFTEAVKLFDRALVANKQDTTAWLSRAQAYYALKDYQKSIRDYTQLLKLQPDSAANYVARAAVYTYTNQFAKSISDLKAAIKLEPKGAGIYAALAEAYSGLGDHASSLKNYRESVRLGANDTASHCAIGTQLHLLNQNAEAIIAFTQALNLDPKNARAYSGRGQSYQVLGKNVEAIADYNKALEVDPNYKEAEIFRNNAQSQPH